MNIEIIGQTQNIQSEVNQWVYQNAGEIERVLNHVRIPDKYVDPRIRLLENQLHYKNKNRCKYYNLTYIRPNIIYINHQIYDKNLAQINRELNEYKEVNLSLPNDFGGIFICDANTIVLPINRYPDDSKMDSCFTSHQLRHEMAHAGSVKKMRVYDKKDNIRLIGYYRSGAVIRSHNNSPLGVALNEGHNTIEDLIFCGFYLDKYKHWKADRFFEEKELLNKKYPHSRFKEIVHAYINYRKLIAKIYDKDPELYRLAEDFIYGDMIYPFARKLDLVCGKGVFGKLMRISAPCEAKDLLQEIS